MLADEIDDNDSLPDDSEDNTASVGWPLVAASHAMMQKNFGDPEEPVECSRSTRMSRSGSSEGNAGTTKALSVVSEGSEVQANDRMRDSGKNSSGIASGRGIRERNDGGGCRRYWEVAQTAQKNGG